MESVFNQRPFSEKIEIYEIYIFVPNSKNLEFIKLLIKYWVINDPANDASMMLWYMYKRKFEIADAYLRRRPSTFLKTVEKKWWDCILKKSDKWSEYVIKNLLSKAHFKSLIAKWLIYHKDQELNDFELKN